MFYSFHKRLVTPRAAQKNLPGVSFIYIYFWMPIKKSFSLLEEISFDLVRILWIR